PEPFGEDHSSSSYKSDQSVGTGMGSPEYHPVHSVSFQFDSGMYSRDSRLVLRYDPAWPRPLVEPWFRNDPPRRYAPEMPR
ncbi:MAG: hypothetical protein KDD44_14245, partial [Bdellovibrionales bacterium]|nr:hypothetical protein [Bdellovibrionales bacterium]